MTALVVASLACAAWVYLLLFRGGFWRAAERDDDADVVRPAAWPRVAAVVPARNEASVIAESVASLLRQDYPGQFEIIVVDDHSTDATAAIARNAAADERLVVRLVVISAPDLPAGWTGKVWAMNAGVRHADGLPQPPDFLLFTDADITYAPETLTGIVMRAQRDRLVLASLMAKLHCESLGERALMPAFIFFFRLLYPFAWVNRPEHATAAAAGGCMLVRREALRAAGGIASIRSELIDDCALARILKKQGPIWLGLTERARSLRAFRGLADIRPMISRCAYAQLRYSPWLLIGTVLAIAVTCVAPPLLTVGGTGTARWLGVATWALMALAMQPTLRFYGVSRWWGPVFPAIAAVYLAFTLDSAYQHRRGRGGLWKGRPHAPVSDRR